MSDDAYLPSALQKKLASRGATDACPMCGTRQWGLLRKSNPFATGDTFAVSPERDAPKSYGLVCLKCGFLRWHVADVLDEELQLEQPSATPTP